MANAVLTSSEQRDKLIRRDFRVQVASLGQARTMTRQLLQRVLGDLNPEYITLQDCYSMRKDAMLKMGLWYRKAPLYRMDWHIECEGRPDIAAGIDQILRQRWGSYSRIALQKYDFGFKGAIQRFEYGKIDATFEDKDGTVRPAWDSNVQPMVLDRPTPLPVNYSRVELDDRTGEFKGIRVMMPLAGRPDNPVVPPEHCLWAAHEFEESDNNWYGYPLLGYAYRFWWSSWFRHHMEDRHFEQKADPPLLVDYPEGTFFDETGRKIFNRDVALQMGDDLRGGATIAKPSTVYKDENGALKTQPLWDAKFLTGGENMDVFRASAEYLDVMKLRSMMVPEEAVIEGIQGSGSRATAGVRANIFEQSLEQEGDDHADLFNQRVIPRIQDANWGPDTPRARMVVDGQQDADVEFLQGMLTTAFGMDPNALPINWEQIIKQLKVPAYTAAEQEERRKAEEEAAAEEAERVAASDTGEVPIPGAPTGPPTSAPNVNNLGQYYQQRDVILLHAGAPKVKSTAPGWAHDEAKRRERNVSAVSARLHALALDFYKDAFATVSAEAAGQQDLSLAATDVIAGLVDKFQRGVQKVVDRFKPRVQNEMASMYFAGGAAELQRLGLDGESWDVGRVEVQDWARDHAGELVKTLSQTVVQQHLRPWLEKNLADDKSRADFVERAQGMPVGLHLANEMSAHFEGYPTWMAERLVRSEARKGYNLSALDMWERLGVEEVDAYDGLGGKTGVTDAECLKRNGKTMTIEEARKAEEEEHPNGTLGFIPVVTADTTIKPLAPGRVLANLSAAMPYALAADGTLVEAPAPVDETRRMKHAPRLCSSCQGPLTRAGGCTSCSR